jgi:GxxExxY protein
MIDLPFVQQLPVALSYKGLEVESAYRIDFLVASAVVVEVKSVERLCQSHAAQLRTYLKFMSAPVGLLINFNVARLVHGIQRLRR